MYSTHRHWDQQHDLYPAPPRHPAPQPPWPSSTSYSPPPPPMQTPYTQDLLAPRLSLAGSLDPATGIFYRSPEHPRLRTAQACEKCRTRKAKCSGEHPTCKRCSTRGLVCEYAKEGRVRGPNKPKQKSAQAQSDATAKDEQSLKGSIVKEENAEIPDVLLASAPVPIAPQQHRRHSEGRSVRPRPSHLRLDAAHSFRGPTPHQGFVNLFAHSGSDTYTGGGGGDSGESSTGASPQYGRRSCSLSESGGSVPPSAVSSTFDLSPSPIHTQAHAYSSQESLNVNAAPTSNFSGVPPGVRIHQLGHEQQRRLLDPLGHGHTQRHHEQQQQQQQQQLEFELDQHQRQYNRQRRHAYPLPTLDTLHQLNIESHDPHSHSQIEHEPKYKYPQLGIAEEQYGVLPVRQLLQEDQQLQQQHEEVQYRGDVLSSPVEYTSWSQPQQVMHYDYDVQPQGQPAQYAFDADPGNGGGAELELGMGGGVGGHNMNGHHGHGHAYGVVDSGDFCT
ncbi:hypothetical protein DXG01_002941 [Tephrocybe rancida]|nr:hypothetical protein DXG01_002941 [Tephrocybe rancida]